MREVNKACIDLIKQFEGLSLKPYPDPATNAEPSTIGYGTTIYPNGLKVKMSDRHISEEEATEYLLFEVQKTALSIDKMIKVSINDNEYAALVCFAYNVGTGALQGSTLMKLLNSGADKIAVADQFLRWNKAAGKVMTGLTRRRQAERALFLQPCDTSSKLPSGPSDEDINKTLDSIEKDILKS